MSVGKYIRKKMSYSIRIWFRRHSYKIVWFIMGWLVTSGLRDIAMGNYIGGLMSLGFAYLNYILNE